MISLHASIVIHMYIANYRKPKVILRLKQIQKLIRKNIH